MWGAKNATLSAARAYLSVFKVPGDGPLFDLMRIRVMCFANINSQVYEHTFIRKNTMYPYFLIKVTYCWLRQNWSKCDFEIEHLNDFNY
jgi:hypothetical protein